MNDLERIRIERKLLQELAKESKTPERHREKAEQIAFLGLMERMAEEQSN